MAGYWPSSFFACLFVSVHKHAKKGLVQYPAILTKQAWSIKHLLYGMKHHKVIFDLAGPREKSRGWETSCLAATCETMTEEV